MSRGSVSDRSDAFAYRRCAMSARDIVSYGCGCVRFREPIGDGWWIYEIAACRWHPYIPARFWMAPCTCVAWSDGLLTPCNKHAFLSPVQSTRGQH